MNSKYMNSKYDVYNPYNYCGIIETEKAGEWSLEKLHEQMAKALNPEVMEVAKRIPLETLRVSFLEVGDHNRLAFSYTCSDINVLDLMQRENLLSLDERNEIEQRVNARQTVERALNEASEPARVQAAHDAQMPKLRNSIKRISGKLDKARIEKPGYKTEIDEIEALVEQAAKVTDYMELYDLNSKVRGMWKRVPVSRH